MDVVRDAPAGATARWRFAFERAGTHSLLIWPPLAVAALFLVDVRKNAVAFDFRNAYLPAAHAVLAGHSPYPPATIVAFFPRTAFIYPPLTAYLAVPFTVVPPAVAAVIVSVLAIGGVAATLLLLGVRDWRCFMIAYLWVPTYSAIQTGNVTILLALGLALAWRYRNRTFVLALVIGFLLALKLFLWPVLAWLIATRRFRAAGSAVGLGVLFVVGPWAGIGFAGMTGYPHLLSVLSEAERADQYTVAALVARSLSWRLASSIGVVVGLTVLGFAARAGRRDERRSFALTITALLLLSPIVGMHYFALLLIVVALFAPRFGWAWSTPLLLWIGPQVGHVADWRTATVLAIAAATVVFALRRPTLAKVSLARRP
jgi:alpha-1,2-mannosyltransferase